MVKFSIKCLIIGLVWSGSLLCVKSNQESLQERSVFSSKKGSPPKITNMEILNKTATGLFVTWKTDPSDAYVNNFNVTWSGNVIWEPSKIVQGIDKTTEYYYILTYLIPYSEYEICIQAIVDDVSGDKSCEKNVTEETIPSAPTKLQSFGRSGSSMEVDWSKPLLENGNISHYNISWRLSVNDEDEWMTDSTTEMSYEINNLIGCGFYEIQVNASTAAGQSQPAYIWNSTLEEAPPAVKNFKAEPKSPTSIFLTWNPPATNCTISNYTLKTKGHCKWNPDMNITMEETIIISEGNPQHLVKDLTPWTNYNFSLIANINETLYSNESFVSTSTEQGPPGKPKSLQIVPGWVKKDSLLITWEDPEELNGELQNFKVTWEGDTKESQTVEYENELLHSYLIENLSSNSKYKISVMAKTSAEYGAPATIEGVTSVNTLGIVLGVTIPIIIILILTIIIYANRKRLNCSFNGIKKAFVK